jgi:hypothetical protein
MHALNPGPRPVTRPRPVGQPDRRVVTTAVPGVGLEPTRLAATDFESVASADSAIRAWSSEITAGTRTLRPDRQLGASPIARVPSTRGRAVLRIRSGQRVMHDDRAGGSPTVSIVMPAHNEEALLEESVRQLSSGLLERDVSFEIIVVENGSVDATADIAHRLASAMPSVRADTLADADYGSAIRQGILCARGELVVLFDVDYFDLVFLMSAIDELSLSRPGRSDIVLGVKRGPGSQDGRSVLRRFGTAVFSTLLRRAFGLRVVDTHGMKAMRRSVVLPILEECTSRKDLFDTELVLRADRRGVPIAQIPVAVRELRPSRSPIARRAVRSIVGLVRLRITLWRQDGQADTIEAVSTAR